MMRKLNSKDKAPDFDLKDQNGQNVGLSDFTGKRLFLYFYPKANTSG
jgi:peroxiredoxin Q/BCP